MWSGRCVIELESIRSRSRIGIVMSGWCIGWMGYGVRVLKDDSINNDGL